MGGWGDTCDLPGQLASQEQEALRLPVDVTGRGTNALAFTYCPSAMPWFHHTEVNLAEAVLPI